MADTPEYDELFALWSDPSRLHEFRARAPAYATNHDTPPIMKIKTFMLLATTGPDFRDGNDCLEEARSIWAECRLISSEDDYPDVDKILKELEAELDDLEEYLREEAELTLEQEAEEARQAAEELTNRTMAELEEMVAEINEKKEAFQYAIDMMGQLNSMAKEGDKKMEDTTK